MHKYCVVFEKYALQIISKVLLVFQKKYIKTKNRYKCMCWVLFVMALITKELEVTFVCSLFFQAPSPSLCPGFKLWWTHVREASWSTLCRTPDQPDKGECPKFRQVCNGYCASNLSYFFRIKSWTLKHCCSVYGLSEQFLKGAVTFQFCVVLVWATLKPQT